MIVGTDRPVRARILVGTPEAADSSVPMDGAG